MSTTITLLQSENSAFKRLVFKTLEKEKALYAPLEIELVRNKPKQDISNANDIKITWQGREIVFQIEIKSRTAPKIVQEAFFKIRNFPSSKRETFLLIIPYITPAIREIAEREAISCLDLNGNYLIQNSKLLAVRLDRKNRFPESAPIKKIFSGNSSQVGRLFLTERRTYKSVNEILEAITRLGGYLSLSAISKVLSALQGELIIEKSNKRITLLQPEKLLNRLLEGYTPPKSSTSLKLKIPGRDKQVYQRIANELAGGFWMLSGESSIERYTMTTTPSILRIYTSQIEDLLKFEDSRFYNVILENTAEPYVYFGRQISAKDKVCWASRLQTYFELARMDKRERELSESIRNEILKDF